METVWELAVLVLTGIVAGAVNAIAGGGPLVTLAGMVAIGVDPKVANLTSTVALSPGQIVVGAQTWRRFRSLPPESHALVARKGIAVVIGALGGAAGALLLLHTDPASFRRIVVWLVLFATGIYALSGRGSPQGSGASAMMTRAAIAPWAALPVLVILGVYGGYFGGGNSFLIMALFAAAGLGVKEGVGLKNIVVAAINAGAVVVFVLSSQIDWSLVLPLACGGLVGSMAGARLLDRLRPEAIRPIVILCGLVMAGWLALAEWM